METNCFFELLRSFTQLTSLQLERAQEHLHHHLQQDLLRQALTEHQGKSMNAHFLFVALIPAKITCSR